MRSIRINSPGGHTSDALALGYLIRARNLDIKVDGICASACAYLVLPAARNVDLTPGSLVVFHHTTSLVASAAAQVPSMRLYADLEQARAESKFYEALGLDSRWLFWPGLALHPVCVRTGRREGAMMPVLMSRKNAFVPAANDIRSVVPHMNTRNWPASQADATTRYQSLTGRSAGLVFGLAALVRDTSVTAAIDGIKGC